MPSTTDEAVEQLLAQEGGGAALDQVRHDRGRGVISALLLWDRLPAPHPAHHLAGIGGRPGGRGHEPARLGRPCRWCCSC